MVHAVEQILQVALRLALLYYSKRPVAAAQGTRVLYACKHQPAAISTPTTPYPHDTSMLR